MSLIENILESSRWSEIGFPHTKEGLRKAQAQVHPDICHDPRANDAFIKVTELFNSPQIDLRLAAGYYDNGSIKWVFEPSNYDLRDSALRIQRKIWESTDKVKWVPKPSVQKNNLISEYGEGWWVLSDFKKLDERTSVWIWRRLLAVISVAEKCGYVHGDINSNSVVVHPKEHGLRLDAWWTAVDLNTPLQVSPVASTPPAFLSGNDCNAELSISQASSMLLTYDVAENLRELLTEWRLRPVSVEEAYKQSNNAIEKDFGESQWHELSHPDSPSI